MEYKTAWDYQEQLLGDNVAVKSKARREQPDAGAFDLATHHYFLLCEHPPVYTLGKSGKIEHVLISDDELEKNQIGFFHTNRGGDITFHGLQQIVGYPII